MANRPKRTAEKDDLFFASLRNGLSVTAAAASAGYKRRTLYEWRHDDDEFRAEWDAALEEGTDVLEDEALRRALHGTDEPVFHQGYQCGSIRKYSDTLTIFLLKARRPEKYREKMDLNVGGELSLRQRSDEEINQRLAQLMAAAGIAAGAKGEDPDGEGEE